MPAQDDAYFLPDAGSYVPSEQSRGAWAANTVNGRLMGGLAVYVVEQEYGEPGFQLSRLTVDLFRAIPYAPLTVTTELVRKGGRIRVADAQMRSGGELVARAALVYLRPSTEPAGEVWAPAREWDEPPPDPSAPNRFSPAEVPVDMRPAYGRRPAPNTAGRARVWVRDKYPIVPGTPLTPLLRAALAADAASPVANRGSAGLEFINTDFALQLARPPVGVFFGLESLDRASAAGIAVSQATLYDEAGILGFCSVTALANPGRLRSYHTRRTGSMSPWAPDDQNPAAEG